MLFKNKNTGLTWEVTHPDHIKRCKKDDNYEEVKPDKKEEADEKKEAPKKPSRKQSK